MTFTPANKIIFTPEEKQFIKDNFYEMTSERLAAALGRKMTRVRTEAYAMGLKKIHMRTWTKYEVQFLIDNYKEIGDTELAEILNAHAPLKKKWKCGNIEKKRRYLKLKRTSKDLKTVRRRNTEKGMYAICVVKRWQATGVNPIGTICFWHGTINIKTKKGYMPYAPYLWRKHYGKIPKGFVVKSSALPNEIPTIDQLSLITRSDLVLMNKNGFDVLPPELKTAIKLKNKLLKTLKDGK